MQVAISKVLNDEHISSTGSHKILYHGGTPCKNKLQKNINLVNLKLHFKSVQSQSFLLLWELEILIAVIAKQKK